MMNTGGWQPATSVSVRVSEFARRSNVPRQLIRQQQPFTLPGLLVQRLRRHPISHCDLLLHMRNSTSSWLHLLADVPLAGSQFAGHLAT